jgi:ubiquinone/menaquinone biosynthesis C-methylase UbiE
MSEKMLFDDWPERYERWFTTPTGKIVRETEGKLIHELLDLKPGEEILDAGCGTGIFTLDFLNEGAEVVGLDISVPMLSYAGKKIKGYPFSMVRGDMLNLPFKDNSFDKAVSVTALEFIEDAECAVNELLRVTRPGGFVVVATLNSLSPWATRRKVRKGRHVLEHAFFRSPDEVLSCCDLAGDAKTCIYFNNDESGEEAIKIEQTGRIQGLNTGAFVAARWQKPG